MGNFFLTIPFVRVPTEAKTSFRSGLQAAKALKFEAPSKIVETEWVCVASFPRLNGSGTPIVSDPKTGSWLFAMGTWFHSAGYGCGAESRLLQRYLEGGPTKLCKEIEGFFVIVIGDSRTRETVVITDLVGSCHCFARPSKTGIALSGSSLLLASLGNFNLDPVGCQEFLRTGVIYEDRTIYSEVRKLGPASVFWLADGNLKSTHRYWSISDLTPESLDKQNALRVLWDTLTQAAKKIGTTFPRPVCDLTGGYDSRALVAAFMGADVRFSTVVSGPTQSADVLISSALARRVGLPHLHLMPSELVNFDRVSEVLPLTDGEYDLVEYAPVREVHETLRDRFDISINGSFGEIARGYWWELLFPRTGARSELDAQKLSRLRFAANSGTGSLFPPEIRLDLISHLAGVIEKTNAGLSMLPNTVQMDHAYLMMRMQRWQGRIASSTNRIWPCLSPFLFRSVLETMLQTKARFRRRSLFIRQMLVNFQTQFANFPLEHGYPAMPVNWRNVYRFCPVIGYYTKKIFSKAVRVTRAYGASEPSPTTAAGYRTQFWNEQEVRELLEPSRMRLGCLVDVNLLAKNVAQWRARGCVSDGLWRRLVTLEYTLWTLESNGTGLSACSLNVVNARTP